MDGMLGKMIWNDPLRQCMAVPSFRLDEKCHFSYHVSDITVINPIQPLPKKTQKKILPRNFQSQDNGTLGRQCRCHRSKSFPGTCRWSGDDLQNLRKPRIHPRKPGLRSTSCEKLQDKKRLITNCRGEMMRDTKYDVIQKLSLQSGPHDYVTSLANWRPEDCMQTGKWIQCRHRRRGFGEGISVLNWMQCHEANGAILMPTMRTSLLLLNHQRLWSPTNSSNSHLHWLLGKRNSYWFHAALKRCLSQVASCTHLWEAIGAAALSFLIVFNDMGPIVYVLNGYFPRLPSKT